MRWARMVWLFGLSVLTEIPGAMRVSTLACVWAARGAASASSRAIESGWTPPIGMRNPTSARHVWASSLCTAAVPTEDRCRGDPAKHAAPSATMAATATQPAVPDCRSATRRVGRTGLVDLAPGLFASGDAAGPRLLAGFERLVHLEEVLDLVDQLRREIGKILHVVPPRLLRWHAQDLGVLAGFVAHVQHTDGSGDDPHAGKDGIFEQDQSVQRVAVAGQGFGNVSVVGRIGGRREQPSVEVDAAGVVIDLVLVTTAAGDLHDDVNAVVGQRAAGHVPCSHIRPRRPDRSQ